MNDDERRVAATSASPTASPLQPERWDVDVVLTSGRTARVRAIRPTDADALRDLHARLSPETRLLRFFTPMPTLPDSMVERFVNVDHHDRCALVVELDEQLIAVGRYDRLSERTDEAEVAFVVDDRFQGEGIGSLLLEHLAAIGLQQGIERFVAETMAHNENMLRVFGSAGFAVKRSLSGGIFDVSFPIEPTEKSEEVRERRDHRATVASLQRLLSPRAVAIIADDDSRLVVDAGDGIDVRPVGSLTCGNGGPVDLAVIDVPTESLGDALTACAAHDVGVAVVVSAGVDAEEQRQLARFARRHGMRVVGPHSLGMMNTAIGLRVLTPGLLGIDLVAGAVGVFAHSPELSRDVLAALADRDLGISTFVSAGDKTDVSGNDLLEYWEDDDATSVVVFAVENFGNPRRFARLAERLCRSKPVIIIAPDDAETAALCRRTGVVRAETVAAAAQTAAAFALHPDWYRAPTTDDVLDVDVDSGRLLELEERLERCGSAELDAGTVSAVLDLVGLGGWAGPAGDTVVRGRQDARLGPLVEVLHPTRHRVVTLAPLTGADVAAFGDASPALIDVVTRVGTGVARLADLAELQVTLTPHDTPAHTRAAAGPNRNGQTQIVRRLV